MIELSTTKLIVIFIFIYFLPTFISLFYKSKTVGIFLFNLLFGWTVIGWISILFEAFRDPTVDRYGFDSLSEDEFNKLLDAKTPKK